MSTILKKDVSVREASEVLAKFFKAFPNIQVWQDAYVDNALAIKKLVNPFDGRILFIEGKDLSNKKIVAAVRNESKNYPCQSTNATVIKIAMIKLQKYIFDNKCKSKMVNTIHDKHNLLWLNRINCWEFLRANKLKRKDEISLNVNA